MLRTNTSQQFLQGSTHWYECRYQEDHEALLGPSIGKENIS